MNSNMRVIGAILVLLLVSVIAFEASGLGLTSYLSKTNPNTLATMSDVNYFSLVLETTAIVVIAIVLAIIMFSLFSSTSLEANKRRKLKEITEDVRQQHASVSGSIEQINEHAEKAEQLISKLHQKFGVLDKLQASAETRGKDLEETAEKLYSYERDLRSSADSISNRLDQVQTYWDEQLEDTVETVKRIKQNLGGGLVQVEEGVTRIREQESMAQGFTKKLLSTYEEQAKVQQENNRITESVRESLEATLSESSQLLNRLQDLHKNADDTFQNFSNHIGDYETKAYDQFEDLFSNIDSARHELNAGVEASEQVLTHLKQQETTGRELAEKVETQLDQLEMDRVRIVTSALDDASSMCDVLKKDMEDARNVLHGLTPIQNTGKIEEAIAIKDLKVVKEEKDVAEEMVSLEHESDVVTDIVTEKKESSQASEADNNKLVSFFSRH